MPSDCDIFKFHTPPSGPLPISSMKMYYGFTTLQYLLLSGVYSQMLFFKTGIFCKKGFSQGVGSIINNTAMYVTS